MERLKHVELIVGDVFRDVLNSAIINRSSLVRGVEAVSNIDRNLAIELTSAARVVGSNGEKSVGELFDLFNEELANEKPRTSVLRMMLAELKRSPQIRPPGISKR